MCWKEGLSLIIELDNVCDFDGWAALAAAIAKRKLESALVLMDEEGQRKCLHSEDPIDGLTDNAVGV